MSHKDHNNNSASTNGSTEIATIKDGELTVKDNRNNSEQKQPVVEETNRENTLSPVQQENGTDVQIKNLEKEIAELEIASKNTRDSVELATIVEMIKVKQKLIKEIKLPKEEKKVVSSNSVATSIKKDHRSIASNMSKNIGTRVRL